ncbi:MAG: HDIG domain-containing protein [DPANN group archaeon]|nr:HDIG domain-containing protein [DPANN group archaeon]
MEKLSEQQALALLRRHAPSEASYDLLLRHVQTVKEVAVRIARQCPGVDVDFVRSAALLHDIGRFRYPPGKGSIRHGIEGGKMLRKEGLPAHARVCETHIGVGISREDIEKQGLPLPKEDFLPQTKEEVIISYADNLVAYDVEKDIDYVIDRFRKELGEEYVRRVKDQHRLVRGWMDVR